MFTASPRVALTHSHTNRLSLVHPEATDAAMVRVYTRRADAFADHAGEGLL